MVKDDLIVKVDELTGEQEILREEVANLCATRDKLRERVSSLEDEMRTLKVSWNGIYNLQFTLFDAKLNAKVSMSNTLCSRMLI